MSRKLNPDRPWTPEEVAYLQRYYRARGPTWIGTKLDRATGSVSSKAGELGLAVGDYPGFERVTDVAFAASRHYRTVYYAAKRDGVLRRVGPPGRVASVTLVPTGWAASVVQRWREQNRGEAAAKAGWVPMQDAFALLGVGFGTLQRALHGRGFLAERLRDVRTRRGLKNRVLFHPVDLDGVRVELEKERASVRGLESVKAIALDEGLPRATVRCRLEREGVPFRRALVGGRLMTFVEAT